MHILAISDLHGDLEAAWRALAATEPDLLLSCGDWGDPDQVVLSDLEHFTDRVPVLTVSGNHDPLAALAAWRNRDGTPVLLADGEVRRILIPVPGGDATPSPVLTVAGISGIWAKSNRLPHYITDDQVARAAERAAAAAPALDLLLTHGCASGLADRTPRGTSGGQHCFLAAFHRLRPRLYLCGHLHRQQEQRLASGQVVVNVGATPQGECCRVELLIGGGTATLEPTLLRVLR